MNTASASGEVVNKSSEKSTKAQTKMLNCTFIDEERVSCNGTLYVLPEEKLNWHDREFWIYLAIYIALVLAAGKLSLIDLQVLAGGYKTQ